MKLLRMVSVAAIAALCCACEMPLGTSPDPGEVPEPIHLLLPETIRIHSFTGTRSFDAAGGVKGIEMRIEARDHFDDPAKAFGTFRFELYTHREGAPGERGNQLDVWTVDLSEPRRNVLHWDDITRTYQFKLKWTYPIPIGAKFVLDAYFQSPFTERLSDNRTFVSGE